MTTYQWLMLTHDSVGSSAVGVSYGFQATWTGDAETPALDDLVLPVSQFSLTKRLTSASTVTCSTPLSTAALDGLLARPSGRLRIQKLVWFTQGSPPSVGEDYVNLPGQELTYDRGSRSGTITLRGSGVIAPSGGSVIIEQVINDRATLESGRWIEIPFGSHEISCGDTISLDNGATYPFSVNSVMARLSKKTSLYEINIVAV